MCITEATDVSATGDSSTPSSFFASLLVLAKSKIEGACGCPTEAATARPDQQVRRLPLLDHRDFPVPVARHARRYYCYRTCSLCLHRAFAITNTVYSPVCGRMIEHGVCISLLGNLHFWLRSNAFPPNRAQADTNKRGRGHCVDPRNGHMSRVAWNEEMFSVSSQGTCRPWSPHVRSELHRCFRRVCYLSLGKQDAKMAKLLVRVLWIPQVSARVSV
jgi:hypothetical protein